MSWTASARDAALDRALAEPADARSALAFAGAMDAVADGSQQLPVPVLVSMTAVHGSADENDRLVARGAALAVEQRAVTVGEAAAMADLPASTVADAVRTGCCS